MQNRPAATQSVHDRVIQVVGAAQNDHRTYANPGQQHNWSITVNGRDVYPDLMLTRKDSNAIVHLIEVETAESVTELESNQWAFYARGPGRFWLLVPSTHLNAAQEICRANAITAGFGKWWLENGSIRFSWV